MIRKEIYSAPLTHTQGWRNMQAGYSNPVEFVGRRDEAPSSYPLDDVLPVNPRLVVSETYAERPRVVGRHLDLPITQVQSRTVQPGWRGAVQGLKGQLETWKRQEVAIVPKLLDVPIAAMQKAAEVADPLVRVGERAVDFIKTQFPERGNTSGSKVWATRVRKRRVRQLALSGMGTGLAVSGIHCASSQAEGVTQESAVVAELTIQVQVAEPTTQVEPTPIPVVLTATPERPNLSGGQYPEDMASWIESGKFSDQEVLLESWVAQTWGSMGIFNPDTPLNFKYIQDMTAVDEQGEPLVVVVLESSDYPRQVVSRPLDMEASRQTGKQVFQQMPTSPDPNSGTDKRPLFLQPSDGNYLVVKNGEWLMVDGQGSPVAEINLQGIGQWVEVPAPVEEVNMVGNIELRNCNTENPEALQAGIDWALNNALRTKGDSFELPVGRYGGETMQITSDTEVVIQVKPKPGRYDLSENATYLAFSIDNRFGYYQDGDKLLIIVSGNGSRALYSSILGLSLEDSYYQFTANEYQFGRHQIPMEAWDTINRQPLIDLWKPVIDEVLTSPDSSAVGDGK